MDILLRDLADDFAGQADFGIRVQDAPLKTKQLFPLALALTLPLAGAHAALITTHTALSPGGLLDDGHPVSVSNGTVTGDGPQTFMSSSGPVRWRTPNCWGGKS